MSRVGPTVFFSPLVLCGKQVRRVHRRGGIWQRVGGRKRRRRSSSRGVEESLPRPASAGREGEGSWGGVGAAALASVPPPDMRGPLLRHQKPLSKPVRN
jgi:hypothetical protein